MLNFPNEFSRFVEYFKRCCEILLFMLLQLNSKCMDGFFFPFILRKKGKFFLRFFWGRLDLVVHTLMQNLFYPKSIFCPQYLTINLKSSESSSSTLREIEWWFTCGKRDKVVNKLFVTAPLHLSLRFCAPEKAKRCLTMNYNVVLTNWPFHRWSLITFLDIV